MSGKSVMAAGALLSAVMFLSGSALVAGQAPEPAGRGQGAQGGRGQGGGQPATDFQPSRERNVTATAIPGVIAAGAQWQRVWAGMDNADGLVALPDGSVLFAQEQTNTVRKLDLRDYDSAYVKDTHGTGALAIDAPLRFAFRIQNCVSTRDDASFAARWLAYALPCQRFAETLAGNCA